MRPLTFEQWRESMLVNTPAGTMVECPSCDGDGVTCEECFECGHEKEEDCETCNGDGRVAWGELDDRERKKYLTNGRYHEAVLLDMKAVANWQARDVVPMLVDAGFAVYQDMYSKDMRIGGVSA